MSQSHKGIPTHCILYLCVIIFIQLFQSPVSTVAAKGKSKGRAVCMFTCLSKTTALYGGLLRRLTAEC